MGFLNLAMTTGGAMDELWAGTGPGGAARAAECDPAAGVEPGAARRALGWLAWDYFGRVPKGVGVIERITDRCEPGSAGAGAPADLVERLVETLGPELTEG
jgi:hypothetical protein